ncbi:MAG: PepSY domain-containing protein, partial [Pseudohongiellaceae bacterium]
MLRWKTWLYAVHRWLGIGMCLLILLWFASGIIMMYVEYPELTYEEFLERQPALLVDEVRLSPLQAAQRLGPVSGYTAVSLATSLGRPAYQFETPAGSIHTVFADNGELLSELNEAQAIEAALASGFAVGASGASYQRRIDMDQWTVTASLNPFRPLHRVALHDEAGTQLYVSDVTGQVVRDSDRRERFWNWLGSTIHWI